ncbi:thymidylate kinase-like isoform X4 [Varroa jacobsoni]|uniref:Thymidylate kinase n=1 Tax=Varroa destructor TaxID=109461 RepID=A0A7M7KQT6_VARDE|nr:thymidylate kinase-like isoform X2 [Varroa destructor]XP_022689214.1 thymidylate kinase-like isoform X4 [Varroa jacobsoni]
MKLQLHLLNLFGAWRTMCSNGVSSRGALIVLEGLDRVGKSTQCFQVVEKLNKMGKRAEAWRFPDRTTPLGKVIGDYLLNATDMDDRSIHLLFSANRWEKRAEMLDKLKKGITLVIDRYAFSGVAFSSAKPGLSIEWCRQPDVGLPKPDLVCFLHASQEVLKTRGGYGTERYEYENFQAVVAERYLELVDDTWVLVDATSTTDDITKNLLKIIQEKTIHLPEEIGKLWLD